MATQQTEPQAMSTEVMSPKDAFAMLDRVNSESERAAKERLIVQRADFDYVQRLAAMFARSGCFADVKDTQELVAVARAVVKIKLGESMGFSEAESMTGIDIIQGRIAVGANLRAARMQRAGFSWPSMTCTDTGCWIPLEFQGRPMMQQKVSPDGEPVFDGAGEPVLVRVVVSFTKADAERANLAGKDNYKKDPSSMYFARAITRAQRRYAPGVLGIGALDTYEAQDIDPENGHQRGSSRAAEDLAEKKIEEMERERAAKSTAPGETTAQRESRVERQIEEQAADAKAKAEERERQRAQPKRESYTKDTLPDAESVPEGTECLFDGKVLRAIGEPGEPRTWKTVELAPAPELKRTPPAFGKRGQ